MRCVEFEIRWNQLLDLRQSPFEAAPLADHLDECPRCRERVLAFDAVCAALPEFAPPDLAPQQCDALTDRVLAQLEGELAAVDRRSGHVAIPFAQALDRRPLRRLAGVGLAAAALLGFVLLRQPAGGSAPPSVQAGAAAHNGSELAVPATHPRSAATRFAPLYESAAYQQLNLDRGHELAMNLLRMPDLAVDVASSQQPDPVRTWGTVSDSFRPVATSMNETLHILKRALPAADPLSNASG